MKILSTVFLAFLGLIHMKSNAQDEIEQLTNYINGSQLVIYSESSILSDDSASAITYIDFCSDGTYRYSYDGSFNVKGSQNTSQRENRASGAGVEEHQGNWKVLEYQNAYYLEIIDYTEKKSYYPINVQNMLAGKWKIGNVTYIFAPQKGNCN